MNEQDIEWMLQAQKGDLNAFTKIIEKYEKPLFNFFFRFLGNKETAEDASQQLFLQVYKSLPRYTVQAKFSTYLYRIARNLAINISRKNHFLSFFSLSDFLEQEEPPGPKKERPEEILERNEREDQVKKALSLLPLRQRLAVVLAYFEDCSDEEIAERMECTVSSVEALLFRARAALKKYINPEFGNRA
ncbi:MAG: RNA polymerase sigma factor [Elusimicrobia bacterium]|nr:RNA polymerase sigma factor [Elusimicrobiota bacterium]